MNNKQQMKDLLKGNITPRTRSTPKKVIADTMEPLAKETAKAWGFSVWCSFFLHEPKLPKKLQNIE